MTTIEQELLMMDNYMADDPDGWGEFIRVSAYHEETEYEIDESEMALLLTHNSDRFPTPKLLVVIKLDSPVMKMPVHLLMAKICNYLGLDYTSVRINDYYHYPTRSETQYAE